MIDNISHSSEIDGNYNLHHDNSDMKAALIGIIVLNISSNNDYNNYNHIIIK